MIGHYACAAESSLRACVFLSRDYGLSSSDCRVYLEIVDNSFGIREFLPVVSQIRNEDVTAQ